MTQEISDRINIVGFQIKHYGVSIIFNYPIYLFMILIIPSFIKKTLYFRRVFAKVWSSWCDYGGWHWYQRRCSASHSNRYTPRVDVSSTSQPAQHIPICARDVVDEEHDHITEFEAIFPGSSCVTSMGTLPVTFLVNNELIPLKL